MGPIYDRTKEHLGASDLAVIAARRSLMAMARQLQHGVEPYAPSHGEVYRVRALNVTNYVPEFGTLVDAYRNEVEART